MDLDPYSNSAWSLFRNKQQSPYETADYRRYMFPLHAGSFFVQIRAEKVPDFYA